MQAGSIHSSEHRSADYASGITTQIRIAHSLHEAVAETMEVEGFLAVVETIFVDVDVETSLVAVVVVEMVDITMVEAASRLVLKNLKIT